MGFTVLDLVQLPRTGAQGARALGTQVLAAATAHKVPKGAAAKAHTKLTAAHAALETALVDQFGAASPDAPADEPVIQELDRIVDNCVAGLDGRLEALAKLPSIVEGVREAAALRRRLFPTGLDFLRLPYKLQWGEIQTRLQLIDRDGLSADIDRLAGKQFLPALREAHTRYGRALGMHEPLSSAASAPVVRGAFDAFNNALRDYVVKVVATIDEEDPRTQEAADALLSPLEAWATAAKRSPSTAVPSEPAAPAPEIAPASPATPTNK